MKLTVLVDNNTFIDHYYLGEPAVSYYIEDEEISLGNISRADRKNI